MWRLLPSAATARLSPDEFTRGYAEHSLEVAGEMALVAETDFLGDGGHVPTATVLTEEFLGAVHAKPSSASDRTNCLHVVTEAGMPFTPSDASSNVSSTARPVPYGVSSRTTHFPVICSSTSRRAMLT